MEYARVKVLSLRRRLCDEQKRVLDLVYQHNVDDYNHPAVRSAYQRALLTEHLLEEWTQKYRDECKVSNGDGTGLKHTQGGPEKHGSIA